MKRIRISFIIVGFLFSFYLGTKVNMLSADDISMNNRIAIVNNDQTVIYQDKKYNFGEIFSSKANDDKKKHNYSFDVTTKMNADVGISTGTYDAEILIPSNFSAAIVSINDDVPIQAELEYKINENLDSKYYYKVKDDVINMTNSVTSDISFMYIYEILNQLYYTQTHLQTVVDNYNPLATAYEAAKNYDDFAGHTYETLPLNEDEFANIDVSDNEEQMSQIIKDYIQNYSEVVTAYQVYTSDQSNDLKTEIRTENSYMKKLENVLGTIRDTSMSTGRIGEYMKKLGSFDKNLNKYDYVSAEYDPIFEKIYAYIINDYQFINEQRDMNTDVVDAANLVVCQYQRLFPSKEYKSNYCKKSYAEIPPLPNFSKEINFFVDQRKFNETSEDIYLCLNKSRSGNCDLKNQYDDFVSEDAIYLKNLTLVQQKLANIQDWISKKISYLKVSKNYVDNLKFYFDFGSDSSYIHTYTVYYNNAFEQQTGPDKTFADTIKYEDSIKSEISSFKEDILKLLDITTGISFKYSEKTLDELNKEYKNEQLLTNTQLDSIEQILKNDNGDLKANDDDRDNNIVQLDICTDNESVFCQTINYRNNMYDLENKEKEQIHNNIKYGEMPKKDVISIGKDNTLDDYIDIRSGKPKYLYMDLYGYTLTTCTAENRGLYLTKYQNIPYTDPGCNSNDYPGAIQNANSMNLTLDSIDETVDLIIKNKIEEVDDKSYKDSMDQVISDMNIMIADVLDSNNQLFGKKVDVYDKNKENIEKFVDEVENDKTLENGLTNFANAESGRESVSTQIISETTQVMTNTHLKGTPNINLYNFITEPVIANVENEFKLTAEQKKISMLFIIILVVSILLAALVVIVKKNNKK